MNTVTWVGMDAHARSTHAAAINRLTSEVQRMRFGAGTEGAVAWLGELPGPVHSHPVTEHTDECFVTGG